MVKKSSINNNDYKQRFRTALKQYPWDYMVLIFIAWAIPAFYGLTNRYFIGFMSYDSVVVDQSYEALGVLFEVFNEMFPLALLALVARHFTDKKKISETLLTAIVMQLTVILIFIVLVLIFANYFIDWINTPEGAQDLALRYFRMQVFAMPFQTLSLLFIITIKAMRRGKLAVFLAFVGVMINFGLDVVFISDFSFSMKLGLMGSAYDNIAANMLLFLISGIVLFIIIRKEIKYKFSKEAFFSIIRIGKWTGMESFVRNIGYIMGVIAVVNFIGNVEKDDIGGYNTAMWVMWAIVLIPVLAWTEATQIAIGNAYGKKRVRAMKDVQIISTVLMGVYMCIWVVIGMFAWAPISKWLNQGIEEDVVKYSVQTFQFLIVPYILFTVGSGLKAFYIGIGKPMPIFTASAVVNIGIYIPLGIVVKYSILNVTYYDFLIFSIMVFTLDFIITCLFLWRLGYNQLKMKDIKP